MTASSGDSAAPGPPSLGNAAGFIARAATDDVFAAAHDRSVLLITHRPEGLDLVDRVVRMPARAA